MGIGKRIREAREALGLTQKDLANKVGVTASAITNYETETSHPKEPVMYALLAALNVDANYLFQDEMKGTRHQFEVSFSERTHIEKYRDLDDHGKEAVDAILDIERKRMSQLSRDEIADIVEAELLRQDRYLESKGG